MLISLCDVEMTAKCQCDGKNLGSDFVSRLARSSAAFILHDQRVPKFIRHIIHQGSISQTDFELLIQNFGDIFLC